MFKQAIATGWDCPRAKILVKLREGGTEIFNIQTIGRIRRMPERKHYDDDLLDRCYVYTLDNEFQEGLTDSVSDSFYSYLHKIIDNAPYIDLPKEFLDGSDRYAANPRAVVEVVRKKFLDECDLNHDGILTRQELKDSKGFVFDTKLKTTALEGVARTTKDIKDLNRIFAGEHQINIHDDGFIIRDAKRRIASALQIDESISSNALRILFDIQDKQFDLLDSSEDFKFESDNKLIGDMSHREYCAFLVNNKELLIQMFTEINAKDIVDIEEAPTTSASWHIPFEQYFKQHKKTAPNHFLKKSLFKQYGDNILVKPNRSAGEIAFENWCEKTDAVSWVYRNGDKGAEFFSIIYRMALRRANFYPDYITFLKNGEVWIIEIKGGQKADGTTENIDIYAENKFNALKDYVSKANVSNLKFGFVRYMGSQLYLSNTKWSEDLNDRSTWLPIEVFIR